MPEMKKFAAVIDAMKNRGGRTEELLFKISTLVGMMHGSTLQSERVVLPVVEISPSYDGGELEIGVSIEYHTRRYQDSAKTLQAALEAVYLQVLREAQGRNYLDIAEAQTRGALTAIAVLRADVEAVRQMTEEDRPVMSDDSRA